MYLMKYNQVNVISALYIQMNKFYQNNISIIYQKNLIIFAYSNMYDIKMGSYKLNLTLI